MRFPLTFALTVALAAPMAWGQSVDRSETAAMLGWINEARSAEGLAPLAADPQLDAVAESHSLDMATHRFFSHSSPTTGAPADRAAAAGLAFRSLAENIALNQSPRLAHEALLRSPGHRANLLDSDLRRVGLGIVRAPDGFYVTQFFATFRDDAQGATPAPAAAPAPAPVPAPAAAQAPAMAPAPAAPPSAAPTAAPAPAPAAPSSAAPGSAPPAGSEGMGLPQILQSLPGWFGLPAWTPAGTAAPATPAANTRTSARAPRPTAPAAAPATGRSSNGGFTIPTPFGPIQVGVPEEGGPWGSAAGAAPQGVPGVDPTPTDDDDNSVPESTQAPAPARVQSPAVTRRAAPRTPPRRPAYEAPQPPRTTPGRVNTVEVPPIS